MMADTDLAYLIHSAQGALRAAEAGLDQAQADLKTARTALAQLKAKVQTNVIAGFPISDTPITEHRRNHKSGRSAILDTDPELRAFVLARIDRLTFHQIADEITLKFPVERRLKKSSIHRWWRRNEARYGTSRNSPDCRDHSG